MDIRHLTLDELEAGLDEIRRAPADEGVVEMIVRRPGAGEREVLEEAELDTDSGLVGDNWKTRGSRGRKDGSAHPDAQLTLMRSRVAALLARERERWPLAGDQLYVDLDLSDENLPPGTRLALGTAVVEITALPHTGCVKFVEHFGPDAMRFVNSSEGKRLNLRGVNARIVRGGRVRVGERATRVERN